MIVKTRYQSERVSSREVNKTTKRIDKACEPMRKKRREKGVISDLGC